jgi:hypothetical protein
VALGLQRRSRRVVLRSLLPIAIGHEASVALVVLLVSGAQVVAAESMLRVAGGVCLIGFGAFKLLRPRSHPRWVGMRVSPWERVVGWFLMSSAHGAGLMLFPIVLGFSAPFGVHAHEDGGVHVHVLEGGGAVALAQDAAAVMLHTAAMLVTMGAVALLVYDRLGIAVLRRAWVNFDALWAAAVVAAGVFTLFT